MTRRGEVITTWHADGWPNGWISVERADPIIDIADEVLCEMTRTDVQMVGIRLLGDRGPFSRESGPWFPIAGAHSGHNCHPALLHRAPPFCFTNSMLRVEPRGQPLILYRIGEYDFEKNTWEAAWPD